MSGTHQHATGSSNSKFHPRQTRAHFMTVDELFARVRRLRWRRITGSALPSCARHRNASANPPNLKPPRQEKFLWLGWTFMILAWLLQPLFISGASCPRIHQSHHSRRGLALTSSLRLPPLVLRRDGDTWRIG